MNLRNEVSQEKLIKEHLLKASISRREFLLASIGLVASGVAALSFYENIICSGCTRRSALCRCR